MALAVIPAASVAMSQEEEAPFGLTEEYLSDAENIALGAEVWEERCRFCHGKASYPGKAPKLTPSRYEPGFVFARATFGFRGMPAFMDKLSEEKRKAVVAYVLSEEFAP